LKFLGGKSCHRHAVSVAAIQTICWNGHFSPEHDVFVTAEKWHEAVTMAVLHEEIQKIMCKKI
jgi:ribulose-5-phosphate 4-epimerase/fuculose-1-phosphate aldolase